MELNNFIIYQARRADGVWHFVGINSSDSSTAFEYELPSEDGVYYFVHTLPDGTSHVVDNDGQTFVCHELQEALAAAFAAENVPAEGPVAGSIPEGLGAISDVLPPDADDEASY